MYIDRQALSETSDLNDPEYEHLMMLLEQRGAIEIVPVDNATYASDFNVAPPILEVVRQLDRPPPKDYPKAIKTWFFSKRWSVVPWLLFGVLPLLVGYVVMIKTLLEWVGIIK